MRLVWDIESDAIEATKIHCIVAQDVDTKKIYKWRPDQIELGLAFIDKADVHIGHNLIGYDMCVVKELYGYDFFNKKIYDTWLMSMVLNYNRGHKHGLGGWGEHLGYSKLDFSDFKNYSEEMLTYCVRDVELNTKVYEILIQEFKDQASKKPMLAKGLRAEHDAAVFEAQCRMKGWVFNVDAAETLDEIMAIELRQIERRVHPKLPEMTIMVDKEPKKAKYNKNGDFNAVTKRLLAEYLGHEPKVENWDPEEEFQRSYNTQVTLGNLDEVKEYLFSIGWKPDDWNYKKVGYEFHKTSPKLTTTSLELLGDIGKDIDRYYTTRSRRSILQGWLKETKKDRLSGRAWVIGTPTFRCRHEVITNLPSVDAAWGKEMRSLFTCEDGYKVVGADSAGNQFRALCHYIGDDKFTNEVINGDVHSMNAKILGCDRGTAKRWIYAYLFGGGDRKLGLILKDKPDVTAGRESKQKFTKAIPGLGKLKQRLDHIFNQTKHGYNNSFIPGLDGRRVYVNSAHQSLNYLLQSAEAITCKAAVGYQMNKIRQEGLDAYPVIFYHDETAWVAKEEDAQRVLDICVESFKEAPKQFNIQCMDGDGVIGNNYAEVH